MYCIFRCYILVLPKHIRIDRGTETDVMAAMQMYLCDKHDVLENGNWWRELLERLERFFKEQLSFLAENGYYDSTNAVDR